MRDAASCTLYTRLKFLSKRAEKERREERAGAKKKFFLRETGLCGGKQNIDDRSFIIDVSSSMRRPTEQEGEKKNRRTKIKKKGCRTPTMDYREEIRVSS